MTNSLDILQYKIKSIYNLYSLLCVFALNPKELVS